MNSTYLTIFGSTIFSNILNELDFNNILNSSSQSRYNEKKKYQTLALEISLQY